MISAERIRALAAHAGSPVVTTCYLDVDGRHRPRAGDCERALELLARQAAEQAGATGDAQVVNAVQADMARVAAWVGAGFDRSHVRGLAFFACSAEERLDVLELPRPVHDHVSIGPAPAVLELLTLLDRHDPFAVVLVDRQNARIFRFEMDELVEYRDIFERQPRRHDQGGRSAASLQRHTDELARRHLARVATMVGGEVRRHHIEDIVVGGPDEDVTLFERALPPDVRDHVVAHVSMSVDAPQPAVRRAALDVEHDRDLEREHHAAERLRHAIELGRGVAGIGPSLAAVSHGRAAELVVAAGFTAEGAHCTGCGLLLAPAPHCPACGSATEPLVDAGEEAVRRALAGDCRVEVVEEPEWLRAQGGIGVVLRF